ncbi:4-hydroxybenzoyl-CoA thioesterase [Kordiimonas sediminis]|uniref:4-hydroxybenzoyl-CoA thioesterase n=1 Tax=Kordiimonas sediminis TaxID=1735581 RepID=A0A919AKC2_9PROT|nr:thioesterase family protein [Kordiimonas sediminis]GHF13537.1 4-hydroxybenzoyl-CoA thioesterase [Kordiimonas sediminis]
MTKVYEVDRLIRHGHTDPAGIVYYPRYYEMINETVEDFFRDVLNLPFGHLHLEQKRGFPLAHMETDFFAPSRCDDIIRFCLTISRLGNTSVTFDIKAVCGDEVRLRARPTQVYLDLQTMQALPLSETIRTRCADYLSPTHDKE